MDNKRAVKSISGEELPVSSKYLEIESSNAAEAERTCKVCGEQGLRVLPVTAATHVDASYWHLLGDAYYFSMTKDCPVIYFNNRRDIYFTKREVKTRFGLKESEPPRPICYCLLVTEEQIADEILNKKCCDSLADIERYTRAGTGKWCLTTNPSGKCCREYLGEVVDKYLRIAEERVKKEVEKVAEQLEERGKRVSLEVSGVTCESCIVAVKNIMESVGARDVKISLVESRGERVKSEAEAVIPPTITPEELAKTVSEFGYTAYIKRVERAD